jgi:hypothetical protein
VGLIAVDTSGWVFSDCIFKDNNCAAHLRDLSNDNVKVVVSFVRCIFDSDLAFVGSHLSIATESCVFNAVGEISLDPRYCSPFVTFRPTSKFQPSDQLHPSEVFLSIMFESQSIPVSDPLKGTVSFVQTDTIRGSLGIANSQAITGSGSNWDSLYFHSTKSLEATNALVGSSPYVMTPTFQLSGELGVSDIPDASSGIDKSPLFLASQSAKESDHYVGSSQFVESSSFSLSPSLASAAKASVSNLPLIAGAAGGGSVLLVVIVVVLVVCGRKKGSQPPAKEKGKSAKEDLNVVEEEFDEISDPIEDDPLSDF